MNTRSRAFVAPSTANSIQRRHRPDNRIILFTGLLMLFGLIIMYAIGPQRANILNEINNTNFYSDTYFAIKQAISLVFAGVAFIIMSRVPFDTMKKHSMQLVGIGLALCAALYIGGNLLHINAIAINTLGAYRWFNLGPLGTFQPAEVLKFSLLLYIAALIGHRSQQGLINDLSRTIYPVIGLSALALFIIIVLQKDMGTGVATGSMIAMMMLVSGMSLRILAKFALIAVLIGALLIVFVPHRRDRFLSFFNDAGSSATASTDSGYHIKNAMIALGTGGLFGLGIGNSVQATGYLPEAINDSVFAIIGETFGFIGATVVVILFASLLLRILKISDHLPDASMRVAAAGIFGWLAAHVLMNIASMVGLMPITGITLPMLSFGGTSMVFVAGALGLVHQLSRYTVHGSTNGKGASYENSGSRRGIGGSRYSGRRRVKGNHATGTA